MTAAYRGLVTKDWIKKALRELRIRIHDLSGKGQETNSPENPANSKWLDQVVEGDFLVFSRHVPQSESNEVLAEYEQWLSQHKIPVVLSARLAWWKDKALALAEVIARNVQPSDQKDKLLKKLVLCNELLSEWGLTFNWKEWRTDTKHVSDALVSKLVHQTCSREWDDDLDEFLLVRPDYMVESHRIRTELDELKSAISAVSVSVPGTNSMSNEDWLKSCATQGIKLVMSIPGARPVQQPAPNKFASGRDSAESEQNKAGTNSSDPSLRNEPLAISVQQPSPEPKCPDRIKELQFGLRLIIEKAKHDEYGTFEDVRNRIIALAEEVLSSDAALALRDVPQGPNNQEEFEKYAKQHRLDIRPSEWQQSDWTYADADVESHWQCWLAARQVPVGPEGKK